jgi:hypothetical protein
MGHIADTHQGTLLVQGKTTYTFYLEDGRKVHGRDFIHDDAWPWQQSLHAPGCRYVRLRAKSPTYGAVTVIIVDKPGEDRIYLFCLATSIQVTRLLRAWFASQPDRASLPHPEASAGDRRVSGPQRRRLLRAFGASPDGELYPLLYESSDLQGASDDG